MTLRARTRGIALLTVVLLLIGVGTASAGDFKIQTTFGSSFFSATPPCPVSEFPTFESIAPVPNIIDPFQEDLIPMFCQIQVQRKNKGVKKAKGVFISELLVLDQATGTAETFPIRSGRFKTDSEGLDSFDFEIPAEIFADGFESGDVSAWTYTRADFTNRKKADAAAVSCGTSGYQSSE